MRKGAVYITFAVLSSSLLLFLAAVPVSNQFDADPNEATRIGKADFFLGSVLKDMERSLEIATRRALTGATNYVVETGESLAKPDKNVTSALVNGTISGVELNSKGNASLREWRDRVSDIADRSGYSLEIQLENYSLSPDDFQINSSYSVFARLKDPATLAQFNVTKNAETSVSISGLEDTMILLRSKGRYVNQYTECSFDKPAEELHTAATHSQGAAHGEAEVNPSDADVANASEKILVVDDIDSYDTSDVKNFAGAVSRDPNSSSGYDTEYAFDTGSISGIGQNMSLIINQGEVWNSHFRQMFREGCYVSTDRGPGFIDRLENDLVGPGGFATLVDVAELPDELQETESAVGYVYFNGSGYGSLNEIKGVSSEHSWFRLDDHHVDYWDLESLVE